jgi:hypothetical protein
MPDGVASALRIFPTLLCDKPILWVNEFQRRGVGNSGLSRRRASVMRAACCDSREMARR